MKDGRIYYQSKIPQERLEAAQRIELARQDFCAGRATKAAFNYARFLVIAEHDAKIDSRHKPDVNTIVLQR